MKTITAENLAMRAYTENEPIDYKRIDYIKRTYTAKDGRKRMLHIGQMLTALSIRLQGRGESYYHYCTFEL